MTVMPLTPPVLLIAAVAVVGLAESTIGAKVGGWLTGETVTVKDCCTILMPPLALPPLSITVTVIVAVPLVKAAGAKVSDPDGVGW